MGTDLCHQIRKFSLAHGLLSDNSIPWSHTTASDLFVVLKGRNTNGVDSELKMRIIRANTVVESIDIGTYTDRATETRLKAEQAGIKLRLDDLPIFAIHKASLLAIRYQMQGKLHRVQLNMQNIAECQQVANALCRRGMEVVDQTPRSGRPETGWSIASATETRPTSSSVGKGPQSAIAPRLSPNKESVPAELSKHTPLPMQTLIRDKDVVPEFAVPTRPSTSQMYRSHTLLSQPPPFNISDDFPRAMQANGAPSSEHLAIYDSGGNTQRPLGAYSPAARAPNDASKDSALGVDDEFRESISQPHSRPGSSALLLPPLPRPNPIKESFSSSTLRASSSSNAQSTGVQYASSLKRSSEAEYYDVSEGRTANFNTSSTRPLAQKPISSRYETERPKLMDELLRRRQPLVEASRNNKVPRLNSLADAPHEIVSPRAASIKDQASEHRAIAPATTCGRGTLYAQPTDQECLETYASQSQDDRRAVFEEFMAENIDNPDFTKLCEDVENYWRRIALHL